MPRQPSQHFGMLVGGVVVEDNMDRLVGGDFALDGVEKADEFEVTVALHAAANDGAVEHAERRKRGYRLAASGLDRTRRLACRESARRRAPRGRPCGPRLFALRLQPMRDRGL